MGDKGLGFSVSGVLVVQGLVRLGLGIIVRHLVWTR